MSEVRDVDTARDGSADSRRPEHALRTRARRARKYFEEVKAAHKERIALLEEQHAQWAATSAQELELLELEARAAEEGERRDAAQNGTTASDETQVVQLRID